MSTWKVDETMPSHRVANGSHLRLVEGDGAGVLKGRFRRARELDDCADQSRRILLAVNRAKQGDREALRYLYVRYADNVYGYVLSIVRDEHEAEDVTQHVFCKLMRVIGKYEEREVPFSAWILRVARNVAVDHMRQRRAVPCEEVRSPEHANEHDLGQERSLSIRDALATLPDEQRQVVYLRHVAGLSPGEIATRLGRSEPSIHGLHHRGRSAMRTALSEQGAAPVTLAS